MSNERGSQLYSMGRHEQAEQEFRAALIQEPNNALAHAMIGLCLLKRKAYGEATSEAQTAIGLRPDWAFGYAVLANIFEERERLKEAAGAIEQAIGLDPFNPQNLAILATIRLKQNNWNEALAAANRGLEIDPENAGCVNARGVALVHLGRRDEANETIAGALSRNPENATTHANQGWALLHSGDHRAALKHFREALRLDPELKWAKAGIVEAMKARNPIYRVMLKYFLFMARMSPRVRWGIVIGGWAGYQLLNGAKTDMPAVRPLVLPVMVAYIVFVYLSWLAAPAFNLMLRVDRFGRYALSRDQTVASNWFGACLVTAAGLGIWGWASGSEPVLVAAVLAAVMSIPIMSVFYCSVGWPRWTMAGYSAALAAIAGAIVAVDYLSVKGKAQGWGDGALEKVTDLFLVGVFCCQILANALVSARAKK